MKRRLCVLAAALVLCLFTGCGEPVPVIINEPVEIVESPSVQETITPVPEKESEAVNMIKADAVAVPAGIENVIGTKEDGGSFIQLKNETGGEITQIYIRKSGTEDWGSNQGKEDFILKRAETAVMYLPKDVSEEDYYDLSVIYQDDQPTDESWFRYLPVSKIDEIVLKFKMVNGTGVPYAEYREKGKKETISTYQDVLSRLGIAETSGTNSSINVSTEVIPEIGSSEDSPAEPAENQPQPDAGGRENLEDAAWDPAIRKQAEGYIGMNIDSLLDDSGIGNPHDISYSSDSDMGEGGFYYFDGFTVITSIDSNGSETVSQIW